MAVPRLTGGGHDWLLAFRRLDSGGFVDLPRLRTAFSGGLPVTTQAWGLLVAFLLVLGILAWPLGRWLATVMEGRFAFGTRIVTCESMSNAASWNAQALRYT